MKKIILLAASFLAFHLHVQSQDTQQALIEAVQAKNLDAVKKVVEQLNADVNKPYDNKAQGKPYALIAACRGIGPSLEIVKYLLEKGADVNVEDRFGMTPLMALMSSADTTNRNAIAPLLIEKGADVNAVSGGGGSILGYASENNHLDVMKLLIAKGAKVDGRKNAMANTPLMYAANKGHEAAVDLLLSSGADPKAERKVATAAGTFDMKKAADFAREKGFTALADKLANAKKVKVKK